MRDHRPAILFDGVCNLCNASVDFVVRRDPKRRFRLATMQSEAGRRLLADRGVDPDRLDTVALVEGSRVWVRSAAALQIARRLRSPWPLAYVLIAIPRPLRDWVYDVVARRRYRWFGRRETCRLPTPEEADRFL